MKRDEVVLLDLARAARLVKFKEDMDKVAFLDDWKTAAEDVPELLGWLEPHLPKTE
jgi:hypothetical protein